MILRKEIFNSIKNLYFILLKNDKLLPFNVLELLVLCLLYNINLSLIKLVLPNAPATAPSQDSCDKIFFGKGNILFANFLLKAKVHPRK